MKMVLQNEGNNMWQKSFYGAISMIKYFMFHIETNQNILLIKDYFFKMNCAVHSQQWKQLSGCWFL